MSPAKKEGQDRFRHLQKSMAAEELSAELERLRTKRRQLEGLRPRARSRCTDQKGPERANTGSPQGARRWRP